MSDDTSEGRHEIVIVRRRGGDGDGEHHGGAWKIAYADFVTAMMAFFLVMWLINASNEATRAQVASYFNPIKLTDSTTGKRGLKDKKDNRSDQNQSSDAAAGGTPPAPSDVKHEAELMSDPDKVLKKIEAEVAEARQHGLAAAGPGIDATTGRGSGIGDPFDPLGWSSVQVNAPVAADKTVETPGTLKLEGPAVDPQVSSNVAEQAAPSDDSKPSPGEISGEDPAHVTSPQLQPASATLEAKPSLQPTDDSQHQEKNVTATAARSTKSEEAQAIASEISAKMETGLDNMAAAVVVKATDEGILVSLTDTQNFGMFQSGSAEPRAELVHLVEVIAKVLRSRNGYIVLRGHTDSKPYRIKNYDNWQLSTARAHLAQYMLVRGGLDGSRIRRIEGLADRDPKNKADPEAPENRRIEILLGHD